MVIVLWYIPINESSHGQFLAPVNYARDHTLEMLPPTGTPPFSLPQLHKEPDHSLVRVTYVYLNAQSVPEFALSAVDAKPGLPRVICASRQTLVSHVGGRSP